VDETIEVHQAKPDSLKQSQTVEVDGEQYHVEQIKAQCDPYSAVDEIESAVERHFGRGDDIEVYGANSSSDGSHFVSVTIGEGVKSTNVKNNDSLSTCLADVGYTINYWVRPEKGDKDSDILFLVGEVGE